MRNHQTNLPGARLSLPELDDAAALKSLERRQPQPHARAALATLDPVVLDLEHEGAIITSDPDAHVRRAGVLVGVADRLGEHRLGEWLERRRHVPLASR